MSFRHMVALLLIVSVALAGSAAMAIRHYSQLPDLYRIELESDFKDVARIRAVLRHSRSQLEQAAGDFRLQNAFELNEVLTRQQAPGDQLWMPPMIQNLDGITVVDAEGKNLHHENYQRGKFKRNLESGIAKLVLRSPNFKPTPINPQADGSGFVATSSGIVLLAAVSVNRISDDEVMGYVIAWHEIDDKYFELISELSQAELRFVTEFDFGERFTHQEQFQAMFESEDMMAPRDDHGHIYWLVPDFEAEPLFFVRQQASPRIFTTALIDKPTIYAVVILLSGMLLLYWVLERYTFSPLERAAKLLNELADNPDDQRRLPSLPAKELNSMFGAFNKLLSLILAQKKILEDRNLELGALSATDSLTGVNNRRSLDEHLLSSIAIARRIPTSVVVLMIDIDEFKPYNDNYGHQLGDETLKKVAVTLDQQMLRTTDFFSRYGGEEFCAVIVSADSKEAEDIAKRMIRAVRGLNIVHEYSRTADYVTISVGASVLPFDQHEGTAENVVNNLLQSADRALYQAKRQGRNQVVLKPYETVFDADKSAEEQTANNIITLKDHRQD